MWLWQTHGREEICGPNVFQVNLGPLHGTDALVWPPGFDVEILHQGYTRKEGLTSFGLGKKLGDASERLKDAVLAAKKQIKKAQNPARAVSRKMKNVEGVLGALQCIRRRCSPFHGKLKQEVNCVTMFFDETSQ